MIRTSERTTLVLLLAVIAFTLSIAVVGGVFAQDDDNGISPAEAPTKTPTPSADNGIVEEPTNNDQMREPLTQADLSILTGNVQRPNGMAWYEGNLYISCNGDWTIYEVNDATGASVTYIYGVRNAHMTYPEADETGTLNLWIPDFQTNSFVRVTRTGIEAITSGLQGPWGVAKLDDSKFAVTNIGGNTVTLIDRNGTAQDTIVDLRSPTGIATDGDFVYVANNGSARRAIEWFSMRDVMNGLPTSAESDETSRMLVTGLQNPTGLAMGVDGNLYFAYSLGTRGVVGRVDPVECMENGGCTNDQVEIVLYTELAAPLAGLTLSDDMRLFVHTMFSPDIYWTEVGN